jgi:hypothetical protein
MHLAEAPVKIELHGSSTGGSGPDLTGYPHLTYAPGQWGDGVRVASNGKAVWEIAETAQSVPIERTADMYGVSVMEAAEAFSYARATGTI